MEVEPTRFLFAFPNMAGNGSANAADLSPLDRLRFYSMLSAWFNTQDTMFHLHKTEAIGEELYAPWEANLRQTLGLPGIAEWCRETATLSEGFARLVCRLIDEIESGSQAADRSTA